MIARGEIGMTTEVDPVGGTTSVGRWSGRPLPISDLSGQGALSCS
jgi:hypothetical protein